MGMFGQDPWLHSYSFFPKDILGLVMRESGPSGQRLIVCTERERYIPLKHTQIARDNRFITC